MVLLVTQKLGQRGAVFLYQQSVCPRTFKLEIKTGHLSPKRQFSKILNKAGYSHQINHKNRQSKIVHGRT
ncbi:hypothetical protein I79_000588 [Cricetulus griseus]|uniref:Uncharacterized protein n=1 Tax=Cricetulus griseus TaxID=10029 RepID=G3GSH4_CRIGR|nr:hypothetical protein I79_000588 [Cricetulus griseus]